MRMILRNTVLGVLGLIMSVCLTGAAELPAPLLAVQPEMRLVGSARMRVWGLHIYDISLYSAETPYTTNSTAVLTLHYNVSIKRDRLLETTLEEWDRLGIVDSPQRREWIGQLAMLWPDVRPGDTLTALRRGNGSTDCYQGDRMVGEVKDPAFGPAFFAIWLDANCSHPKSRESLLGMKTDKKNRK